MLKFLDVLKAEEDALVKVLIQPLLEQASRLAVPGVCFWIPANLERAMKSTNSRWPILIRYQNTTEKIFSNTTLTLTSISGSLCQRYL